MSFILSCFHVANANIEMTQMLELSHKNCKAAMMNVL